MACNSNIENEKEIQCDECEGVFHSNCIMPNACNGVVNDLIHLCQSCSSNYEICINRPEKPEVENVRCLRSRVISLKTTNPSQIPVKRGAKRSEPKEKSQIKAIIDKYENKLCILEKRLSDLENKPCNCLISVNKRLNDMEQSINTIGNSVEENSMQSTYSISSMRTIESIIDSVHNQLGMLIETIRVASHCMN